MQLLPLILTLHLFAFDPLAVLIKFFLHAGFNSLDLLISTLLSNFDHLDEIVWLKNSSMGLNLDDISIDKLLVGKNFFSDNIPDIDNAVIIRVSIIVEEYVLSSVIRLVNQKKLADLPVEVVLLPIIVVVINSHR